MKKLSQQILLSGAIFFMLAIAPLFTSNVLASSEDGPYNLVAAKASRLLALLNEKQTEANVDLGYCPECESKQMQNFKDIAEETTKYLGVYKVVTETVISGDTLSALKKQARVDDEEAPTAKRRLLEDDKPLATLVMAFPEKHTPILTLDMLGECEYARAEILAPLQNLFPSENLEDLVPAINGWIHNLSEYDLSGIHERKEKAAAKLQEANSVDLSTQQALTRERDIAALVIEVVEGADDLWKELEKRYTA